MTKMVINMIVLYFTIVILLFLSLDSFSQQESIPSKLLKLREETERGISYFITKDFSNSITILSNSVQMSDEIISLLSNEITSPKGGSENIVSLVEPTDVEDKSIMITAIRKSTTEAIKFYIMGNIPKSIEKVNTIKRISLVLLEQNYLSLREVEFRKALEEKLSSIEKTRALEREIIDNKVAIEKLKPVYITNIVTNIKIITNIETPMNIIGTSEKLKVVYVTNIFTNVKIVTNVVRESERVNLLIPGVVVGIALLISLILLILTRIRIRKRIKDLSELM
ncbi:MAG: hypothetical protein ABDH28_01290 [Brevinematia bacterium]